MSILMHIFKNFKFALKLKLKRILCQF